MGKGESPDKASLTGRLTKLQAQIASLGINCKGLALWQADEKSSTGLEHAPKAVIEAWEAARARVDAEGQLVLQNAGSAVIVAYPGLQQGERHTAIFGAWLEQPVSERAVATVQLGFGWLTAHLLGDQSQNGALAAHLLEMHGHVLSQKKARSAAQEWINRLAQLVRARSPQTRACSFSYFRVDGEAVKWVVSSDTSWLEKGSAPLIAATELATRASLELREQIDADGWALPILAEGKAVAVLVSRGDVISAEGKAAAHASAHLMAASLHRWDLADRNFAVHAVASARQAWTDLWADGHLRWKVGVAGALAAMIILFAIPVSDRVSAQVVVEPETQQVITAPFEGFLAEVLVRPGDSVKRGQVLARFDDRELKLEYEKARGDMELAGGKLRQATADRDYSAMQIASAELEQAEAALSLVESKLSRSRLMAPLDGVVVTGDWNDKIGSPMEVGKKVFEVAPEKDYRVVLHVLDSDVSDVLLGQAGEIRLAGLPGKKVPFHVSRITSVASVQDSKNGFRVEARLDAGSPAIRPGMQGVGKIETGRVNLFMRWTRPFWRWLQLKLWSAF